MVAALSSATSMGKSMGLPWIVPHLVVCIR
jgi:hypothetical protein